MENISVERSVVSVARAYGDLRVYSGKLPIAGHCALHGTDTARNHPPTYLLLDATFHESWMCWVSDLHGTTALYYTHWSSTVLVEPWFARRQTGLVIHAAICGFELRD